MGGGARWGGVRGEGCEVGVTEVGLSFSMGIAADTALTHAAPPATPGKIFCTCAPGWGKGLGVKVGLGPLRTWRRRATAPLTRQLAAGRRAAGGGAAGLRAAGGGGGGCRCAAAAGCGLRLLYVSRGLSARARGPPECVESSGGGRARLQEAGSRRPAQGGLPRQGPGRPGHPRNARPRRPTVALRSRLRRPFGRAGRASTVGLVRLGRRLTARDDDDVVERAPGDHLRHEAGRDQELGAGVHRRLVSVGGKLQWDWS